MSNTVWIYAAYGAISVILTIWLARTLFMNGAVFLEDVFAGDPRVAQALNRLLVVGFYLLNFGYLNKKIELALPLIQAFYSRLYK